MRLVKAAVLAALGTGPARGACYEPRVSESSAEPRFVNVFVDPNPNCEDGCALRFKAEDEPRVVRAVRWFDQRDVAVDCDVVGWSSENGGTAVPATAVTIEDSSSGTAVLVWGGDWGVRLTPRRAGAAGGAREAGAAGEPGEPFGAPEGHLRIAPEDVLA